MKPAQAFGVSVRIIGLLGCFAAILYLMSGVMLSFGPTCRVQSGYPAWQYFVVGTFVLVISIYFLRGARMIMRFAYPDDSWEGTQPRE
jgi:hypothetical protein